MSGRTIQFALTFVAAIAVSTAANAAPKDDAGRRLTATMTGAEEVPVPGDPNGSGSATFNVNVGQGQICYTINVSGIEPVFAAHIHVGAAGSAGPPVVTLDVPEGGMVDACEDVDRETAVAIVSRPSDYYVNVHTETYPGGALRGQLAK